jgi:serine/threonine protein kinase/WD40 repeat protein
MSDSKPGLMTIFTEALARPDPAERVAYLDGTCGGDAELRRRVEELLAAHTGMGRFLEPAAAAVSEDPTHLPPDATAAFAPQSQPPTELLTGAHPPDAGGDVPPPDSVAGSAAGTVIAGRYTLVEVIGEGGMGSVYLATQTEPVKRQVALKLIKSGMDSKAVLDRFDAERQALAVMDHPNIARILDGGLHDNRPFFVMELVKGTPITKFCDERRLTPQQRLELFVPVCQAIQHAHQKGIIHRDIKPSNVLVALYDDRPLPKVIDFGVAKATGLATADASVYTAFGAIVGTPEYMSPEQASLSNQDIDTRSDVYALGVLLYELLTGTTPVDRKHLGEAALLEVLRVVREEEAPRPSTKLGSSQALASIAANRNIEPAKLSRLMQGELDWILLKALEKDRSRRYESANGFARDIQNYLAGEPVQAVPPSTGYRLKKFVKKNKGRVTAGTVVLLALVAGTVAAGIGLVEARRQRDDANVARDQATRARGEADRELNNATQANASLLKAQAELRTTLYAARMNLLTIAWEGGNYDRVRALLDLTRPTGQTDDPAGFEWHYWDRRACKPLHTVTPSGSFGIPSGFHYSRDGSRHAFFRTRFAGDPNDTSGYRICDTMTGNLIRQFDDSIKGFPFGLFQCFHLGRDGKRLLLAGGRWDKSPSEETELKHIQVWDVDLGTCLCNVEKKWPGTTTLCRLSPDNSRAVVVTATGQQPFDTAFGQAPFAHVTVRAVEVATGKEVFTRTLGAGTEADVQITGDGAKLLVTRATMPEKVTKVEIWDAATGNTLIALPDRFASKQVKAIVSEDGTLVTTANPVESGPSELKLWDAGTGREVRSFKGDAARLCSWGGQSDTMAFNLNGSLLGAIDERRRCIVWDVPTGEIRQVLPPLFAENLGIAFGTNDLLYSSMSVWEGGHDDRPVRIKLPAGWRLMASECSPTGNRFGAISTDAKPGEYPSAPGSGPGLALGVWNASGKELLRVNEPGSNKAGPAGPNEESTAIESVRLFFSADGDKVAALVDRSINRQPGSGFRKSRVRVWDLKTGRELKGLEEVGESNQKLTGWGITDAWFTPDGTSLTAIRPRIVSNDTWLTTWDVTTGKIMLHVERKGVVDYNGAQTLDGKEIWLTGEYIGYRRLKAQSGDELEPVSTTVEWIDGKATDKILPPGPLPEGWVGSRDQFIAFTADGTQIISKGNGGGASLTRVRPPEPATSFPPEAGVVSVGALSPDGRRMAVGGTLNQEGVAKAQIVFFDVASKRQVTRIIDFPGQVAALGFTPDGQGLSCLTELDNGRALEHRMLDGTLQADRKLPVQAGH